MKFLFLFFFLILFFIRIRIQNEQVTGVQQTATSDSLGEFLFQDLASGWYKYHITADNHQEARGRFRIKPGVTAALDVFVDYTLVTVEWSVTEITLEDRYEITLDATYETQVPAAVVVGEPGAINLPLMEAGDVFYGEITLTNHGLIRADDLNYSFPANDAYFRFEPLVDIPDSLDAKNLLSIPYRVVSLQSLAPTGGGDSGGGCYSYTKCTTGGYAYTCASGTETSNWVNGTCWHVSGGSCGGGGGGSSGGGTSGGSNYIPPGTPGSGTYSPATHLPIAACVPEPEPDPDYGSGFGGPTLSGFGITPDLNKQCPL